jgi:hypothetical protein
MYEVICPDCNVTMTGPKQCESRITVEDLANASAAECGGPYQCILPAGHEGKHQVNCEVHPHSIVQWDNLQ